MTRYLANYFDDIGYHLKEALSALGDCISAGLCFLVLLASLPLLMLYIPIRDIYKAFK